MFMLLNHVLGIPFSEAIEKFKRFEKLYIPTRFIENKERGSIKVLLGETNIEYTVEELTGMIFSYLKAITDHTVGFSVTDCVITVPPFYTMEQRKAILDAASLSGLKVLSLLHETTATAIQYGLTKLTSLTAPMNALFFDFGSSSLKVSIVRYRPNKQIDKLGTIRIRGIAYDNTVGGKDFEALLAKRFAEEFQKQHGVDLNQYPRAMARLMITATKVKEVLSANTETIASVESLHDDIDFRMKVTRKEFEELSKPLLDKIIPVVQEAIEKSKIKVDKISALELIGGTSRIPIVQKMLKTYFNRDLQYSLNADECIALGATFHAAELSPSFQVKKFEIFDLSPYQIEFSISGNTKKHILYQKSDSNVSPKIISIPREQDFDVTLEKNGKDFMKVSLIDVAKSLEELKPNGTEFKKRVSLTFKMNNNGFVYLETSAATLEEGSETKRSHIKSNIIETFSISPFTKEQRENSLQKLNEFQQYEIEKRALSKARNELESYIYSSKSYLDEDTPLKPFQTESERKALEKGIEEYTNWLDLSDENTPLNEYTKRYESLLNLTKPFLSKQEERNARVKEFDSCKSLIPKTKNLIETFERDIPYITKEEREKLLDLTNEVERWLDEKKRLQENIPLNETPVVFAHEIKKNCQRIIEQSLILVKKPPPPKEEKKEEEPKQEL